ncbi:MAG: UbiD family decarboxylase [Phycisphaeraceae bacterium]|nr:UbiD family decarboxylase [Phycisphaeraceae bacterium]MCB9848372.1 UbiD family decarboxylase [Phycisphaeraceae bacterium]
MFRELREFVLALESSGELRTVSARVSPELEIGAITDRVSKSPAPASPSASTQRNDPRFAHLGGRALLFEDVEGSDLPVLINAFGSYRRMEMALGCHEPGVGAPGGRFQGGLDGIAARIGELIKPEPPASIGAIVRKARALAPLLRTPPRRVRFGQCQEVVHEGRDLDLSMLPLLKCWPLDGDLGAVGYPASINGGVGGIDTDESLRGRYITFAHIHTIHADDAGKTKPASHNVGMYRVQRIGRRRLAMHWHMHHDGARHWRSWKRRGERMPVAIVLGGESVLPFAAIAPLPPGVNELLLAGFLNGRGIPMVPGRTVPISVPANAEIVIEGYVSCEAGMPGFDPRDPEAGKLGDGAFFEGPFGDHTGFYSMPDRYPIVEVTAITTRRDPIFPATIVGLPPQEDYYMGKAVERLFLPLLRTMAPDVLDYDLPMFGAFHNCAVLKIDKEYPLQARRLMHGIWGAGQMAWTKNLIVVDGDVDVHDTAQVMRVVGERCDPATRIERTFGPLDILDHAAPALGAGSKLGFDATARLPGEGVTRRRHAAPPASDPPPAPAAVLNEPARALCVDLRGVENVRAAAVPASLGGRWLFVSIDKQRPGDGRRLCKRILAQRDPPAPRFTVVVDAGVDVDDFDAVLFRWCANVDAERDALTNNDRVAFDATAKVNAEGTEDRPVRDWPPIIEMSASMLGQIERRWSEYGID